MSEKRSSGVRGSSPTAGAAKPAGRRRGAAAAKAAAAAAAAAAQVEVVETALPKGSLLAPRPAETVLVRSRQMTKVGRIVSNKNDKTVVVAVEFLRRHRLYKKMLRRTSKFHAHDEFNECQAGDLVRIVETRPLSRLKRWRVTEILERAIQI